MLIKQVQYLSKTASGGNHVQALFGDAGAFVKTAGAPAFADWATGDQLRKFISKISAQERKDNLYVLVNALGAGEYFGSNINADYFPWESLKHEGPDFGYQTFLNAHAFQHHVNKDPTRAFGVPVLSVLNHPMKRVELIVKLDRAKARAEGAEGIIVRLDSGEFIDVSMGCKVPYDVCSICGNKSVTKDDYCTCMRPTPDLRGIYGPNRILFDGRKIFVYNYHPRFFDISFVFIGADKTAKVMAKLASKKGFWYLGDIAIDKYPMLSAEVAEATTPADDYTKLLGTTKTASAPCPDRSCSDCEFNCGGMSKLSRAFNVKTSSHSKLSEIIKNVPASEFAARRLPAVEASEPDIDSKKLDELSSLYPISQTAGSLATLGVVLKPHEYQRLVLKRMGEDRLADELDEKKLVFRPVDEVNGSSKIEVYLDSMIDALKEMRELIRARSCFGHEFSMRVIRAGLADAQKKILPTRTPVEHAVLDKVSAAYNGYRRDVLMKLSSATEVLQSDPKLADMVMGNGLVNMFSKTGSASIITPDSIAYLAGAHLSNRGLLSNSVTAKAVADNNQALLGNEEHPAQGF